MWTPVVVAACVLAAGGSSAQPLMRSRPPWNVTSGRILGGETVDISQYPWQVSVMFDGAHVCGGSVISPEWVLTAAHCIIGGSKKRYRVRAGTSELDKGGTVHRVSALIRHGRYNDLTMNNDIGLIKIEGSISMDDTVKIVNLGTVEPKAGTSVTVTGWGTTEKGTMAEKLQAVTVKIQKRASCKAAYKDIFPITSRMICAGVPQGGKDACQGDSGGPLVEGNTQYGIVSFGEGCGHPKFPGVYTNVAALRSWIKNKSGV